MPINGRSWLLAPPGFVVRHVVAPLALGSVLYLAFRSHHLLMFNWAHSLGLTPAVGALRDSAAPLSGHLPAWVIYSLPNALWAYSLTAWLTRLWGQETSRWRWLFLLAGPALSVGVECGQAVAWISGTFCWQDLSLALFACLLGWHTGGRPRRFFRWHRASSTA